MMLTTKVRYAVMAMIDLALLQKERENKPVKLAEIAERQGIALNYLEQIFAQLKHANLVSAVKGPGGGYVIAEKANINMADIADAVQESVEMTRCGTEEVKGGCMPDSKKCITHDIWEGLTRQIRAYLASIKLSDMCSKATSRKELAEFMGKSCNH